MPFQGLSVAEQKQRNRKVRLKAQQLRKVPTMCFRNTVCVSTNALRTDSLIPLSGVMI
jgi:hypothetical protein